jgi:DNA-binding transcriptional LysR family regulator
MLKFDDLAGAKWVLPPRKMGPREEWEQVFLRNGFPPPFVSVETRSIGAMRTLVARAGFLAWLPDLLLAYQGTEDAIKVLPVAGAATLRNFAVYRRRQGVLSLPTIKLLDELRRVVGDIASVRADPEPASGRLAAAGRVIRKSTG